MYHLVKSVYGSLTRKEEYSVLVLGLDNAGKTTFLETLKRTYNPKANQMEPLDPSKVMPTIGQNVGHVTVNGTLLKIWDVGGQESLRSLWNSYYSEAHAVVFVVDSTDRQRIEECKQTFDSIVTNPAMEGIPILMLANKQDREDCMEVQDIKEIFNRVAEKMSARDSRVLPISALEGTGVKDAAEWLEVRLVRNKELKPPRKV